MRKYSRISSVRDFMGDLFGARGYVAIAPYACAVGYGFAIRRRIIFSGCVKNRTRQGASTHASMTDFCLNAAFVTLRKKIVRRQRGIRHSSHKDCSSPRSFVTLLKMISRRPDHSSLFAQRLLVAPIIRHSSHKDCSSPRSFVTLFKMIDRPKLGCSLFSK